MDCSPPVVHGGFLCKGSCLGELLLCTKWELFWSTILTRHYAMSCCWQEAVQLLQTIRTPAGSEENASVMVQLRSPDKNRFDADVYSWI